MSEAEDTDDPTEPLALFRSGKAMGWIGVITTTARTKECLWTPLAPRLKKGTNVTAMSISEGDAVDMICSKLGVLDKGLVDGQRRRSVAS